MKRLMLMVFALGLLIVVSAQQVVRPQVPNYQLSPDLAEIQNKDLFTLTPQAQQLIAQNHFVIVPAEYEQPFYIYEENVYWQVPHFITVDSVLHLYHLFFVSALRQMEEGYLFPLAKDFTQRLSQQTLRTYRSAPTPQLKQAALRNVAFVGVAGSLLGLKLNLPSEAKALVNRELALIRQGEQGGISMEVGALLPYALPYNQFVPRGHYTRTENLKRYFRALMWYGRFPFAPRYLTPSGQSVLSPDTVRQALLLTHDIVAGGLQSTWDRLFLPINFFVGGSDDLTPVEVWALIQRLYGKRPTLRLYADEARFAQFRQEFEKLRKPRIQPKFQHIAGTLPPLPDPQMPQLRIVGQRYIPDSEVLQELTEPLLRPMPSGLDVMAVLGCQRALQLLDTLYAPQNSEWKEYPQVRSQLIERFSVLNQSDWTRNLYTHWLWVLQSLLQPFGEGYPMFMRTQAWQDKSLQTALGSWAQLRHATVLYAKSSESGAEGGEDFEEAPLHYVEPNLEAWNRLLMLIRQTRQLLVPRRLLSPQMQERLQELEQMVVLLRNCAQKHLLNQPLSESEMEKLQYLGGEMDYIALWLVSQGKARYWYELQMPTDRNMACITDVHTAEIRGTEFGVQALEVGTGYAHEIYVVVPDPKGQLYLARGAVFSYYEFPYPLQGRPRLTDEAWQRMLKTGKAPAQPEWIHALQVPEGVKINPPPAPSE